MNVQDCLTQQQPIPTDNEQVFYYVHLKEIIIVLLLLKFPQIRLQSQFDILVYNHIPTSNKEMS